ncbi:MAG: hypothetical protein NNA30_04355 [Nitrospira sp.]|nr:hypothetical protein [Nitrospira sp.]
MYFLKIHSREKTMLSHTKTGPGPLVTIMGPLAIWIICGLAPTAQGEIVLSDSFEYEASRNTTNVEVTLQAHGWSGVKANNSHYGRGSGYIHTRFDGTRNSRVLVLESLPSMSPPPPPGFPYRQTDYWISYGSESHPLETIPANVWFQFWIYATPTSEFHSGKFIYPCRGPYPCTTENFAWLLTFQTGCGTEGHYRQGGVGEWFFLLRAPLASYSAVPEWDRDKLYQNQGCIPFVRGQWYQIRIHIDVSNPQGVYELWVRQNSIQAWTKHAEWIGGMTPQFNWTLPVGQREGNRALRMLTTVNAVDSTFYLDDFIMATSLQDLESYTSGSSSDTTPPAPPQNPRIAP